MKKILIPVVLILVIIIIIWFAVTNNNGQEKQTDGISQGSKEIIDSTNAGTTNENNSGDTNITNDMDVSNSGKYIDYSSSTYQNNSDAKRIIFFHAGWCPTCRIANQDFEKNSDDIPENVVILKTDYDKEKELKEKYGINYQHTFVQIDKNGNAINKWTGGGLNQLISQVK